MERMQRVKIEILGIINTDAFTFLKHHIVKAYVLLY